jgi:hypothetical protein
LSSPTDAGDYRSAVDRARCARGKNKMISM